jgi:hypothetical protein
MFSHLKKGKVCTAFKAHFVKFLASRWNFFRSIDILIAFWTFN